MGIHKNQFILMIALLCFIAFDSLLKLRSTSHVRCIRSEWMTVVTSLGSIEIWRRNSRYPKSLRSLFSFRFLYACDVRSIYFIRMSCWALRHLVSHEYFTFIVCVHVFFHLRLCSWAAYMHNLITCSDGFHSCLTDVGSHYRYAHSFVYAVNQIRRKYMRSEARTEPILLCVCVCVCNIWPEWFDWCGW